MNEYTNPVTIPGGFIILKLKDIKIEEKKLILKKLKQLLMQKEMSN